VELKDLIGDSPVGYQKPDGNAMNDPGNFTPGGRRDQNFRQ
jgi:hypothetical protein